MTNPDGPSFQFLRHRFEFEVLTPVYFPPYKADNILRGMAGLLLPDVAPAIAQQILHPQWPNAPSGYATPPKPYAFRAHHLDGRRFQPGETIHFDLIQFDLRADIPGAFVAACRLLETEGLGPGRGKLRFLQNEANPVTHSLLPTRPCTQLTLRFLTPTEIDPAFNTLIARLHDRINALSTCYSGKHPLTRLATVDVRITRNDTRFIQRHRHSTRTGQTYETGGIIGEVEYAGALTQALPFLELGQWTGFANGFFTLQQ
jgi:hypothetical protein